MQKVIQKNFDKILKLRDVTRKAQKQLLYHDKNIKEKLKSLKSKVSTINNNLEYGSGFR